MFTFDLRINIIGQGEVKFTLPYWTDKKFNWYNCCGDKFARLKTLLFLDPIVEIYAIKMGR